MPEVRFCFIVLTVKYFFGRVKVYRYFYCFTGVKT